MVDAIKGIGGQVRAARHRHNKEVTRALQLIDKWGNETTIQQGRQLSKIKHQRVLAVLEKRALRYKYGRHWVKGSEGNEEGDEIDDTGTVSTANLTDEEGEEELSPLEIRQEELLSALGVNEEVLSVHGVAPGTKPEGVARMIYENLDGLSNVITVLKINRSTPALLAVEGTYLHSRETM